MLGLAHDYDSSQGCIGRRLLGSEGRNGTPLVAAPAPFHCRPEMHAGLVMVVTGQPAAGQVQGTAEMYIILARFRSSIFARSSPRQPGRRSVSWHW
jgi:hypothetical protein